VSRCGTYIRTRGSSFCRRRGRRGVSGSLRRGQVGYVEDENEVVDRELDDFGIGDGRFSGGVVRCLGDLLERR
jgi:hypothetical protein